MTLDVEIVEQQDKRLGRQKVHDDRSRAFAMGTTVDRSTWRDKAIRIYDPRVNPNQCHGECTGCAKMMQLNAAGNRVKGRVLNLLDDAHRNYSRNTELDPWVGSWPPDDTGSSGLASCKSAIEHGLAGEYRWLFGGADEVVQNIMGGLVISAGTWWTADMFGPSGGTHAGLPVVRPTGGWVGGHQYVLRGFDVSSDLVMGRCWWGEFRDFWISRADLDGLLRNNGDAHFQHTVR